VKIEAKGLYKWFGLTRALVDINVSFASRKVVIMGPNGSGKSTFLSILFGGLFPSKGYLRVNGYEPYKKRRRAIREMAIVFERPYFDVDAKVKDVYTVLRDVGNSDCLEFFWDVINVKSISTKILPELSSGQKQLVQLMQCLCRESRIKILDEPFSHLDPSMVEKIGKFIVEDSKNEYIITTHVPEEAEWLGEYFVLMKEGSIIWHGKLEDIWRDGLYEVYLRGKPPVGLKILFSIGYVAIAKSTEEELIELTNKGLITGYRKAGVRRFLFSET
jgi:ABC-2 type transport system ATP-binding protein